MLQSLKLDLQWVGDGDGPTGIRTNDEPGLKESVLRLESSVGWGQPVKFDLSPEGKNIGAGPGVEGPFPVISWRIEVKEESGAVLGVAELNAFPDREGEVNEHGLPIGIGTRPYDQTCGYGLLVRGGWRRTFKRPDGTQFQSYKPAASGRLIYTVWAFLGNVESNKVPFAVS